DQPIGGIGGTGIVGTLADFGSLIVNGIRIETDAQTLITDAFGTIGESDLAVGDSLTMEASPGANGLVARRVHVTHPIIGPVEQIGSGRVRIAGVEVEVEPGAEVSVTVGRRVAVSGIWAGDRVIASRIAERPEPAVSVLAGAVKSLPAGGDLAIGGVPLRFKPGVELPAVDGFVTVRGFVGPGGFEVVSFEEGRFTGAAGPIVRLSVDGYLDPTDQAPFHEISGLGHSFDSDAKLDPFAQSRWLFDGPYEETFRVATGTALPENLTERRRLLKDLLEGRSDADPIPAR
ncbi:MAG: DUF5666 domain-containing protein, partial [Pseudomonadota bacterium]